MQGYLMKAREPISSLTHLYGIIFSAVATVLLILKATIWSVPSWSNLVAVILFGCSLIALYTASTVYHYYTGSSETLKVLRKLDHAMIYVLIAGTYTPILLKFLPAPKGYWFTAAIWACAIAGIAIKLCWFTAPRWLQTVLYIAMGWAILFDVSALMAMTPFAAALLAAGGISYTVGGIIYILKKPNFSEMFGFHELFHIFVLLGSVFHVVMIFLFVA